MLSTWNSLAVSELLAKKRFSLARPRGVLAEMTTIETLPADASSAKMCQGCSEIRPKAPESFSWGTSEAFDTEIVTAQSAATKDICMPQPAQLGKRLWNESELPQQNQEVAQLFVLKSVDSMRGTTCVSWIVNRPRHDGMLQSIEALPWSSPETRNPKATALLRKHPFGLSSPAWNLILWPYGRRHRPELNPAGDLLSVPGLEPKLQPAKPSQAREKGTRFVHTHTDKERERERERDREKDVCVYKKSIKIYIYVYVYVNVCL